MGRDTKDASGAGVGPGAAVPRWSVQEGQSGIERVGLKRVVPKILILAEERIDAIPLVLADAQARYVVRVAAVAKVAEVKPVTSSKDHGCSASPPRCVPWTTTPRSFGASAPALDLLPVLNLLDFRPVAQLVRALP